MKQLFLVLGFAMSALSCEPALAKRLTDKPLDGNEIPSRGHLFVDVDSLDLNGLLTTLSIGNDSASQIELSVHPTMIRYITIKSESWFASYRVDLIGYGRVIDTISAPNGEAPQAPSKYAKTEHKAVR